jgi:predicted nucleic acid-binding protein
LLRRLEPTHPHYRDACIGIGRLIDSGKLVHVTAQNVAEFWAAATRSSARNGLGLDIAAAAAAVDRIEQLFTLLPEDPQIYVWWRRLVMLHRITGNQVYDARLVAAMAVYGIGRIVTFNVADFTRYGVAVLHPAAVT